jgi:PAS domain S-box-containing protein
MACILIVDDSEENLYMLAALLRGHGHQVRTERNGADALAEAARERPDLIISDILMPKMDGFALCRRWKADPQLKSIPFIFYTATYTDAKDEELALNLGADMFLIKPMEPDVLVPKIKEMLAKREAGAFNAPRAASLPEPALLSEYNATLIRKLEKKLTELEQANQALGQKEQFISAVLDSMPAHVTVLDRDGVVRRINKAWRDFASSAPDVLHHRAVVGQHFCDESAQTVELQELYAGIRKLLHGELNEFEMQWRCQRQTNERWFLVRISRLQNDSRGAIVSCIDLTEQKRTERKYLQAQKMEAIGQLTGGVAHNFNNMLAAITCQAEVIKSGLDESDPLRAGIDLILQAATRGSSLTRQLLAFSRPQSMQLSMLDLNSIVSSLGNMMRPLLHPHVTLSIVQTPQLRNVFADAGQIEQVLMNLVINANDAMPQAGELTIATSNFDLDGSSRAHQRADLKPGQYVTISVRDTGCGMSAEVQRRLFEPFFTTKEAGKGTGLGLATAYGIVHASGGQIEVQSTSGKGSTFTIYLPAYRSGTLANFTPGRAS